MPNLKNNIGSVYGGLGHLLYAYCQAVDYPISEKLEKVQNLERFDYVLWLTLLNDLDSHLQTPALGLKIAQYVQPKHLGVLGYIAKTCNTLGEALTCSHDFHRLIYDGSPLYIAVEGEYLCCGWVNIPLELTTQLSNELAIALLVQFIQQCVQDRAIHLYEVHFTHSTPKNIGLYEQYFNCRVRFCQSRPMVMLPISELTRPLQQGDQTLQKLLLQQATTLLNTLSYNTPMDQQLQHAILTGLSKNQFQIEHIAQHFNCSARQLQRGLQQQGTTYQHQLQAVRRILAEQYLKDPHFSLQEIALLLGYSEQSAFQRAFKHWTQLTPKQWRMQQRGLKVSG